MNLALTFNVLGDIEASAGNLAAAADSYEHALTISRQFTNGTTVQANSLAGLASVAHQEQRLDAAAQLYQRAIDLSESEL